MLPQQSKDTVSLVPAHAAANLDQIIHAQESFFRSGQTRSYDFRIEQLHRLKQAILKHEDRLSDALQADLRKHPTESYITEIGFVLEEIGMTIKKLKKWMKPQKAHTPLTIGPGKSMIVSEPLGRVLVIAPWNYPVQLVLAPIVGAIAAGNVVVVKPSELTPHVADAVDALLKDCFPPDICAVFKGGLEVSQKLLEQRWDHIFFTGSTAVGKIVAMAAAKHLTPCTLELGGKSPCIVTKNANLKITARRIVFGKLMNAGQTCVAPDYVLVEDSIQDAFVKAMADEITLRFGAKTLDNEQLPRIVSASHFQRLSKLIDPHKVAFGGKTDAAKLLIEPTLLTNVKADDAVMQEEIFGPILPLMTVKNLDEAISFVNSREKPLSLYIYSDDKAEQGRTLERCSFGGGCVNDSIVHVGNPHLPFGGVGHSGAGAYHGKASFDCFSHKKSVLVKGTSFDLPLRYAPWTPFKDKIFRQLIK